MYFQQKEISQEMEMSHGLKLQRAASEIRKIFRKLIYRWFLFYEQKMI